MEFWNTQESMLIILQTLYMLLPQFVTRFTAYTRSIRVFHAATSILSWYKMVFIRDTVYRLMWMKFVNMLSVSVQSGTRRYFDWWIIPVLTQNPTVMMLGDINSVPKYVETWVFFVFQAVATRQKNPGFILLDSLY